MSELFTLGPVSARTTTSFRIAVDRTGAPAGSSDRIYISDQLLTAEPASGAVATLAGAETYVDFTGLTPGKLYWVKGWRRYTNPATPNTYTGYLVTTTLAAEEIVGSVGSWTESWGGFDDWCGIGTHSPLAPWTRETDPVIGACVNIPPNSGFASRKYFDVTKPITMTWKMVPYGVAYPEDGCIYPYGALILYSSEAEYWGFTWNQGGELGYYGNASYAFGMDISNGDAIECKMEFDGDQTSTYHARRVGAPTWTLLGSQTFQPTVPACIYLAVWDGVPGGMKVGAVTVTGTEVWAHTCIGRSIPLWPNSGACQEWGIESNSPADYGQRHFTTLAGGITVANAAGSLSTWIQNVASTAYVAGAFSVLTPLINRPSNHTMLHLIGALRAGTAGSFLKVFVRDAVGVLIPDLELPGNSSGFAITTAAAQQLDIDMSGVTAAKVKLDVQGNAANATAKNWPDETGTTGPPVLKALWLSEGVGAPAKKTRRIAGKRIHGATIKTN